MRPELMVTLWPSFPHFPRFARDSRLSGIRLNSAMMSHPELDQELARIAAFGPSVPLWFDVKARQPRVAEVLSKPNSNRLVVRLNHPIRVRTPQAVLFKAGADHALLERLEDDGRILVFAPGERHGPRFHVKPGESLHVRHPSFKILGDLFTPEEVGKIEKVRAAGFTRWFLSYVEEPEDVDKLRELVGRDAEIMLKIETERGLRYAASEFSKEDGLTLVAARGDLYVELERPHEILNALRLIVDRDPEALVGSRILLSTVKESVKLVSPEGELEIDHPQQMLNAVRRIAAHDPATLQHLQAVRGNVANPIPSCSDFNELAWLKDIGYKRMMLCDELCLKEDMLACAINAYEAFVNGYAGAPAPAARPAIDPRYADGAPPPEPPASTTRKRGWFDRILGRN